MDAVEVMASTRDPAFAVDVEGSIVAWNAAATELLGYRRREVLGRKCWQLLRGRDVYGNRYCGEHCPLHESAFRGEPIHSAQMYFRDVGGRDVRVAISCILLQAEAGSAGDLVHLLRPVEALEATLAPAGFADDRGPAPLSARQREILHLLAEGRSTREISESLGISTSTTRNHIQGILIKLKVHSRLEAVALARRLGIV